MCGDGVVVQSNDNQQHVASASLTLKMICGWGDLSGTTGTLTATLLPNDSRGTVTVAGSLTAGQNNAPLTKAQALAQAHP